MECLYCGVQVKTYPENGICQSCGAPLPKPEPTPAAAQTPPTQQTPPAPQMPPIPGRTCCPRCYSGSIAFRKRGFSWLWGIVGFFFVPPFGLLFGFIGAKQLRYTCAHCGHKWRVD